MGGLAKFGALLGSVFSRSAPAIAAAAPAAATTVAQGVPWYLKIGAALGIGGGLVTAGTTVGVIADANLNGGKLTSTITENITSALGKGPAAAQPKIQFHGIYAFVEEIGKMLMKMTNNQFGGGLANWALEAQGKSPMVIPGDPRTATPNTTATTPGVDPTATNSITPIPSELGASLTGLTGVAATAFNAASKGGLTAVAKSIPLLSSAFAAGTGIWDTGSYLVQGDFKRAGVRFASGVADTVLSAGGFLSQAFAVAAREGIEEGAELALGPNVDMPDSPMLKLGKDTWNFAFNR